MALLEVVSLVGLTASILCPGEAGMTSFHASGIPQEEAILGTWNGTLVVPGAQLPMVFHIAASEEGGFTATMDSPAQGAFGIPVSEVSFSDGHLRLYSATVLGEFVGDLSADGNTLVGTWRQGGGEYDLTVTREGSQPPVEPTEAQKPIVGTWLGELEVSGGTRLRMVFNIRPEADGGLAATLDSPDQGVSGLPVSEVTFANGHLRLVSSLVGGAFEGDLSQDGTVLDGKWMQGGMELPLSLERTEEPVRAPARPQEPKPPFPYDEEEVRFTNPQGGHTLAGTLTLPREGGPFPAVVLVTGSGAQDRNETVMGHRPFLVLSDYLTRQGIGVLRYDDRGTAESEGDFATATSEDFTSDALAGVAFLKGRSDIAGDEIGVIGHSEGGLIAPMAAVRSPDVAFIVMMAGPGVTGEEILLEQGAAIARAGGATEEAIRRNQELQKKLFAIVEEEEDPRAAQPRLEEAMREGLASMTAGERSTAGLTGDNEAQFVQNEVRQVNTPWFRFFLTYDPAATLRQVKVPVLAINGSLDLQVPPYQNLPVIERALLDGGNPDVTAAELPGLNHLFQTATTGSPTEYTGIEETVAPLALETIGDWILERVGKER